MGVLGPPPEGDQKLLERLVEFNGKFGSQEEMEKAVTNNGYKFDRQKLVINEFFGGFAGSLPSQSKQKNEGKLFNGPNWFTENMNDIY